MTRYISCGDLHIRESTPGMRVEEDFFEEICAPKLNWIVDISNELVADILIAGDIFDVATTRYLFTNRVIHILRKARNRIYAIPGQHDMNYHSQILMDTPYQSLIEAGVIINVHGQLIDGIYGAGFGLEVPENVKGTILLAHYCITEKEPPFFLKEALSAKEYIEKFPNFKYIVTGDYHVPHATEHNGQMLINCGPMFRKEKTQVNYEPRVYFIDTDEETCELINIPVKPAEKAFDFEKIKKSKEIGISEEMDTTALKELLMDDENTTLEFPNVVSAVANKYEQEHGVKVRLDRLNSIIQRAKECKISKKQ